MPERKEEVGEVMVTGYVIKGVPHLVQKLYKERSKIGIVKPLCARKMTIFG